MKPPLNAARSPPRASSSSSLAKTASLREDVAAVLAGEFVEGAVVALGDADVGVVDDAHHHVGGAVGGMEAGADLRGEVAEFGVGGVLPEVAGVFGRDALAGVDLCGNRVGHGVGEAGHLFIVCGDLPSRQRRGLAVRGKGACDGCHPAEAPAARSVGFASFGRSRLVLWATWLGSMERRLVDVVMVGPTGPIRPSA